MTEAQLAEKVAVRANLSKTRAFDAIDAVFAELSDALVNGESYTHQGFGRLRVVTNAERKGRNPRTGEEMTIPARAAVKFSMGKALKERLNP